MSKTIENNNLVYKFYNVNNELLYVGITNSMKLRLRQHKQDKFWANEIKKICVSDKMTRNEAHIYEIYYIANENPLYNVDHTNGGKVSFIMGELLFKEYKKEKRKKINIVYFIDMGFIPCHFIANTYFLDFVCPRFILFVLSQSKFHTICNTYI